MDKKKSFMILISHIVDLMKNMGAMIYRKIDIMTSQNMKPRPWRKRIIIILVSWVCLLISLKIIFYITPIFYPSCLDETIKDNYFQHHQTFDDLYKYLENKNSIYIRFNSKRNVDIFVSGKTEYGYYSEISRNDANYYKFIKRVNWTDDQIDSLYYYLEVTNCESMFYWGLTKNKKPIIMLMYHHDIANPPWEYFIFPNDNSLDNEFQWVSGFIEKYKIDKRAMWGKERWN
jgi:hypothetical protein